jgi:hypothetical protein
MQIFYDLHSPHLADSNEAARASLPQGSSSGLGSTLDRLGNLHNIDWIGNIDWPGWGNTDWTGNINWSGWGTCKISKQRFSWVLNRLEHLRHYKIMKQRLS